MALLIQIHDYADGGIINSTHWNAELDQLIDALNGTDTDKRIIISGQSDGVNEPTLLCRNNSTGNLLFVSGLILDTRIVNSGVIRNSGDGASVEFVVSSDIKCSNLNAEFLGDLDSSQLQQRKYAFETYQVFYKDNDASTNPDRVSYLSGATEGIITKLKAQQRGVASADASTIIDFLKNGVSVGTVTISGNTTAVQTNDIADTPINLLDILTISVTTYAGGTKHTDITAAFHFKRKFIQGG